MRTCSKILVGAVHNVGVVLCERLTGKMNGKYYASIVGDVSSSFKKTTSPKVKRILADGDPSQNSKVVMSVIQHINGKFFQILARLPDLNPIENLFQKKKKKT